MMGHSHAMSGALAWTVAAPIILPLSGTDLTLPVYAAGLAVTAGCALLPDLDHPSSTIARTFGPITQLLAQITNVLAGGHRMWTHSLAFTIGAGAFTWLAQLWWPATTAAVIMFLAIGLAMRGLHLAPAHGFKGWLMIMAISFAGVFAAQATITQWAWMPYTIALGVAVHCLGDALTPGGVKYLLPWRKTFQLGLLPATGSFVETGILTPAMGLLAGFLAFGSAGALIS